jgi:S-adenosylmethionine-diacylgycerolhomoserine-N-methlytransferase
MDVRPGDRVLEMGCGTARNLFRLARRHPDAHLYGLDASQAMLDTARSKASRAGFAERIRLSHCLAEDLDYRRSFGLAQPFDVVFFSYSLTMMPTCCAAMDAAVRNTRPGGGIYIVDFWDQERLPGPFRIVLRGWLNLFGVKHRPELLSHLRCLCDAGAGSLSLRPLYARYAYLVEFRRADKRRLVA